MENKLIDTKLTQAYGFLVILYHCNYEKIVNLPFTLEMQMGLLISLDFVLK